MVVKTLHAQAQTTDEWLKQKETQVKYLVEQIGALNVYAGVLNKGYSIARNGLANVFNSKTGDYRQHSAYFLSLWKVNPGVRDYTKVLSIQQMKGEIEKQYLSARSSTNKILNDREISYINSVYTALIDGCKDLVAELQMLLGDDELQLKDDERIQRIDKIYSAVQDRYQFAQSFANEIKLLCAARLKEENEVSKIHFLYGIK